jgi:hypothetical protein
MDEHRSAVPRIAPRQGTLHAAVDERNTGFRKIGRITWRAGAVGLVFSGLLAGVLHNSSVSEAHRSGSAGPQSGQGGVLIPGQPPAPASGSGQVTSGGT